MLLFLSYAEEDGEIARDIAARLRSEHVNVYAPRADWRPYGATAMDPERAIQQADAFLALLSANSLTSASCRVERELAMRRESRSAADGLATDFVRVLQIRDTPYHHGGSLRGHPWFDLAGEGPEKRVIKDLAATLASEGYPGLSGGQTAVNGNGGHPPPPPPHFRNRDRELEEVYNGVISLDGKRFWLWVASPQLGKTWLLRHIAGMVPTSWGGRWAVKWVDVREIASEVTGDAGAILRMLFGMWSPTDSGPADVSRIADAIIDRDGYYLCLLDGAELLDVRTIYELRQYLGQINDEIGAREANARVALIAASRRDRGWTGLDPARLPEIRRLTEFSVGVVRDALEKLAASTGRRVTPELIQHAVRVHELSEGLPALLTGCLDWTRGNWTKLDELNDPSIFGEIARPYVEEVLLAPNSLRGSGGPLLTDEQQQAIRLTLRVLSPFRLFTGSHLSELADHGELRDALRQAEWSAHDLWTAVSGADLLYPAKRGAWKMIDPPIRRLLFRYWYPSRAARGEANRAARDFLRPFALDQSGTEAADMLVECLWHEAQALILLDDSAGLEASLTQLGTELSMRLKPSRSSDVAALRDHAIDCMRTDPEVWGALSAFPGLFDRLADAIAQRAGGHP